MAKKKLAPTPAEPRALYGELLGDVDGEYKNCEDGKRHAAGPELKALFKRERARHNAENILVTFQTDEGVRSWRPDRFCGDGSDARIDPETGDLLIDGFRIGKGL